MASFDGKYQNRAMHFCASSRRFRDINDKNFDFQKVGQGRRVQISQSCVSMENITINKSRPMHVCAISNRFKYILTFQICDLKKVGQGYGIQFSH